MFYRPGSQQGRIQDSVSGKSNKHVTFNLGSMANNACQTSSSFFKTSDTKACESANLLASPRVQFDMYSYCSLIVFLRHSFTSPRKAGDSRLMFANCE